MVWGEAHIEPIPGTANGTVVWKITAQFPKSFKP